MLFLTLLALGAAPPTPLQVARSAHRQLEQAAPGGVESLVKASQDLFDDAGLVERALADDVTALDATQRAALAQALGRLLRVTWARRALEAKSVKYTLAFSSQRVSGDEATVSGTLTTDAPHALTLTLARRAHRWRIVDVTLEGASALSAWSTQLRAMLKQKGAEGLVAFVTEKADAATGRGPTDAGTPLVARRKAPDPMELLLFGALEAQAQPSSSPTGLWLLQLWSE